jgi:hypothetical protein
MVVILNTEDHNQMSRDINKYLNNGYEMKDSLVINYVQGSSYPRLAQMMIKKTPKEEICK